MPGDTCPNIFPKRSTHIAVRLAHAIRVSAHPQCQHGHAKSIEGINARLAEAKEFVERKLQLLGELAEISLHHLPRKRVVPRRDGSVGRKDVGRRHDLQRGIEIKFLLHHLQPNAFERQESRMAFVHVKNLRLDSKSRERFYPADAKDNLLANSHLEVAPIKLGRYPPIFRRV